MKFLLIDNYDSFTHMLADYIRQCNVVCDVARNDEPLLEDHEKLELYDAFVLSPGPCTPAEAGNMMKIIHEFHLKKPMLGVCLGHQAIGQYFGAELCKADQPKHGKTDLSHHFGHPLFNNVPEHFEVTRYHSLIIKNIIPPLEIIAQSGNNEVMGLAHNSLPLFGIQFHPESCLTTQGLNIIKNYTQLVKQSLW